MPIRTGRPWKLSLPHVCGAFDSLAGCAVDGSACSMIVLPMQDIHTEAQICVAPAGGAAQNVSLAEKGRQFTGKVAELQRHRLDQHLRETRVGREFCQLSSMWGDLSLWIERAEAGE